MAESRSIAVEVACGTADRQELIPLELPAGATVSQAIEASGILGHFPEIDQRNLKVGVFGRVVSPDQVLERHDRVEIYRPLVMDPREARRKRAMSNGRSG